MKALIDKGSESPLLEMPDVGYASYILDYLFEVGLYGVGGMSITPISWLEIQAWSQLVNVKLTPFEAQILKSLSKSFVDQYNLSDETLVPSPYQPVDIDQSAVSNRVASVLRSLAANNGSRKKKRHGSAIKAIPG